MSQEGGPQYVSQLLWRTDASLTRTPSPNVPLAGLGQLPWCIPPSGCPPHPAGSRGPALVLCQCHPATDKTQLVSGATGAGHSAAWAAVGLRAPSQWDPARKRYCWYWDMVSYLPMVHSFIFNNKCDVLKYYSTECHRDSYKEVAAGTLAEEV